MALATTLSLCSTFSKYRVPIQIQNLCTSPSLPHSLLFPSHFSSSKSFSLSISHLQDSPLFVFPRKTLSTTSAVAEEEQQIASVVESTEEESESEPSEESKDEESQEPRFKTPPCELYVCNIPRSCDISELHELFKPFGTVRSVAVSRHSETGISRGCGYVTMSSIYEAKEAIAALDGSDLGGREMRVRFSFDMFSKGKTINGMNSRPKNVYFESPFKAYVGNLARSVKPEDLRDHFSKYGSVVSARVLRDRKAGKGRVYGFVSFGSAEELGAAVSSSGITFRGREMLVREVIGKE